MVPINEINSSIDLRAIHDQIHNQLLSQRQGLASWGGILETAWAAYVIACHAPENRHNEIINLLKGEILGEKKLTTITTPYDLAACYMIAAFLNNIGLQEDAIEFVNSAENFLSRNNYQIDCRERFHFHSTPEYVYAASMVYEHLPEAFSETSLSKLRQAAKEFFIQNWYGRSEVFALAGTAYLCLGFSQPDDCKSLADYARTFQPITVEDNIPILWFLEHNWELMRTKLSGIPELTNFLDAYVIELRTRIFRSFPSFITEPLDLEQSRSVSAASKMERVASDRIVSTIELLMLDEIAERHVNSALIVTRQEWLRRDTITTIFDNYRVEVNNALENIGLSSRMQAIYDSLNSENPASWSQAALGSRQVLYDLAHTLLQITDEVYPFLQNDRRQPIAITGPNEKNRLQAYLHQIGIRSNNPLLVKELEFIANLMRKLIDEAAATGKHKPAPIYEDVQSLVLHTYFFLGELLRLTKFEIVREIKPPP